jgi:hypothetical protein
VNVTVTEKEGQWFVTDDAGNEVAGPYTSNSQAWRKADHLDTRPLHVSRDREYRVAIGLPEELHKHLVSNVLRAF